MNNTSQQKIIDKYYRWIECPYNNKYKTWHNKLCEIGFEVYVNDFWKPPVDLSAPPIFQSVEYKYMGDFAIKGDHAQDFFMIFACFSKDKVVFYYNSSYIDEIYMGNYGLGLSPEDVLLYLNDIKHFIEKNNDYIGGIKIATVYHLNRVFFCYSTDCSICMSYITDHFTKLAILLDLQSRRKFPFLNIHEYEMIYRQERDTEFFAKRMCENISVDLSDVLTHLVGSSYSQELDDVLRRIEKLLIEFSENSEKNKKAINLLTEAHQKLNVMSSDEFWGLREDVFDL